MTDKPAVTRMTPEQINDAFDLIHHSFGEDCSKAVTAALDLQDELQRAVSANAQLQQQVESCRAKIDSYDAQLQSSRLENESAREQIAPLEAQRDELLGEYRYMKEKQIPELEAQLKDLGERYERDVDDKFKTAARITELEAAVKAKDETIRELDRLEAAHQCQRWGVDSESLKDPRELEAAATPAPWKANVGELSREEELEEGLRSAKTFIEYARYELEPGKSVFGDQFPKQVDADIQMAKIEALLSRKGVSQ